MITQTSFQTLRSMFAGAGGMASLRAQTPSMDAEAVRPIFAGIWHSAIRTQSVILAQAASLSLKQRRLFLQDVAKLVDPSLGMEPKATERDAAMRGKEIRIPGGRFYIFLRSRDFVVAGFEDEKAAGYQGKPFLRYDEYLRARNPHPILAFFSRDLHMPTGEQAKKFGRFVPVDDGRFVGWADECLIDWLGNAERQLGQAAERVSHCFANAPASTSAPHMTALHGFAG
jgi:hypothetical protein